MHASMDCDHEPDHDHGYLVDHLAEDVHFEIVGEDTGLARKLKGHKAVQAMASSSESQNISKIVDSSKPVQAEVVHLIGNEKDPWVAAVLRQVGTGNTGKFLYLSRIMR